MSVAISKPLVIERRALLRGMFALPAVVAVGSLMPIRGVPLEMFSDIERARRDMEVWRKFFEQIHADLQLYLRGVARRTRLNTATGEDLDRIAMRMPWRPGNECHTFTAAD